MSQTIIMFQEDCLLAATGQEGKSPSLTRVKRIGLTGTGDSFARWQQALVRLKEEWDLKEARFVLPAELSAVRVLTLPYSKGRQLARMAGREVTDNFRNVTADYSVVYAEKKDGMDLCAGGVDSGNLERFAGICEEAGLGVAGMTVPMEGYLRILRLTEGFSQGTAIHLFFEGESMTSVLCQEGRYLYSSRSRLFSEPGTLDFGTEIVRAVSGILQFYTGSKQGAPITQVRYAGCAASDFETSVEGLRGLGLQVQPMPVPSRLSMPSGVKAADWLACLGALVRENARDRRIDLYAAWRQAVQEEKETKHVARHLALPIVLSVLCLIPILAVTVLNWHKMGQIEKKQSWLESPSVEERYNRWQELSNQAAAIDSAIAAVEQADENLSVYPVLTSDVLHWIESAGGRDVALQVRGYNAETGVLTFEASSQAVIDIPDYILKLQDTGLFYSVDYTGYAFEDEWYTLSLSCTMQAGVSQGTGGAR